jgi:cobalt/nickel transport protein
MRGNFRLFAIGALLLASSLALLVAPWASSKPDGLTKVAGQEGFDRAEREHVLDDSPVSGYSVEGVDNDRLSTGLAGLIGVLATFGVMVCLLAILRRTKASRTEEGKAP